MFRIISCYLSAGDSNGAPRSCLLPPRAPAARQLVARLRRALLRLVIFPGWAGRRPPTAGCDDPPTTAPFSFSRPLIAARSAIATCTLDAHADVNALRGRARADVNALRVTSQARDRRTCSHRQCSTAGARCSSRAVIATRVLTRTRAGSTTSQRRRSA